jgi:hypothetical protein
MWGKDMLSKGSEWRRWEPHIHAPGTVMNNQYEGPTGWGQIGLPWNTGEYQFAIVSSTMKTAVEAIVAATKVVISSAYRNPKKEEHLNPGTHNSRHIYGDAVDLDTKKNKALWCQVATAACGKTASWVEPASMINNYDHVHADWRGGNIGSSFCNDPSVCSGSGVELAAIDTNDLVNLLGC